MSTSFENNNSHYNYSGFGSALNDIDEIEDDVEFRPTSGIKVYNEILNQIGIDHNFMNEILNNLLKTTNLTFEFIRVNNDFRILFFSDNFGHVSSIPLNKIVDMRNNIFNLGR